MSGFDPRKYHGRPLDEVLRSVNGDVRRALEEAHAVCQLCLRQKNLPAHREGHVRMRLWQVEKQFGLHSWYFSQAGQDRYLNERIFRHKRDGTFVEIGGYDGWTGSNCVFFEKVLGWTGLVVEASPQLVRRIGETRSARVVHTAIADRDGTAEFLDVTSGLTQMSGLLDHYHADVEGAERAVLGSLNFNEFDITALSIENNRLGLESYEDIMGPAGYQQVAVLGVDEIWVRRSGSAVPQDG